MISNADISRITSSLTVNQEYLDLFKKFLIRCNFKEKRIKKSINLYMKHWEDNCQYFDLGFYDLYKQISLGFPTDTRVYNNYISGLFNPFTDTLHIIGIFIYNGAPHILLVETIRKETWHSSDTFEHRTSCFSIQRFKEAVSMGVFILVD